MRSLSLDPPYEFRAGSMVASLLRHAWREAAVFKTAQPDCQQCRPERSSPVFPDQRPVRGCTLGQPRTGRAGTGVPRGTAPGRVASVTGADRAIWYSTIGAVSVVALVAAFVSYGTRSRWCGHTVSPGRWPWPTRSRWTA
jgi:hypothetical protein